MGCVKIREIVNFVENAENGRFSAKIGQKWAKMGKFGPILGKFGPNFLNFGENEAQNDQKYPRFWHFFHGFGQKKSSLSGFCFAQHDLIQIFKFTLESLTTPKVPPYGVVTNTQI